MSTEKTKLAALTDRWLVAKADLADKVSDLRAAEHARTVALNARNEAEKVEQAVWDELAIARKNQ